VGGEIQLGKGSKRKIQLVRWSRSEKVSIAVLFIVVVVETVFIAVWLMGHSFD
jgi:hypothetical protein